MTDLIEYRACCNCATLIVNGDDSLFIDNVDLLAVATENIERAGLLAVHEFTHMNMENCEFCEQLAYGDGVVFVAN